MIDGKQPLREWPDAVDRTAEDRTHSTSEDLSSVAVHYARLGYRVFPLLPGKKKPATANGFKAATSDPEKVAEWWRERPDRNIGIATGEGLFVLDIDRLDGPEGRKSLDNPFLDPTMERLEELGADSVSRSPSGGYHLWFSSATAHSSGAGLIAEGVDHRCNGGYIVAPPSILDGSEPKDKQGNYEWLAARPLVAPRDLSPLPQEVEQALAAPRRRRDVAATVHGGAVIPEGRRHAALVSEAARMRGHGCGEEALLSHLRDFNRRKCSPPQEDDDVVQIARDYAAKPVEDNGGWRLVMTKASEVEEERVEWLVDGRIPLGMLTTFVGLPGGGKSTFATFLAAKLSRGSGMSQVEEWSAREPCDSIIFTFEDTQGTHRARLEEMGADLDRVHLCELMERGEDERCFDLSRDFDLLREEVERRRPRLIVIDPVNSAWPSGKDTNSDADVRTVLDPYRRLARDFGCAVLLITHTNKRSDVSDAQDVAGGARGWLGVARATYLFGAWRTEEGATERFMLDLKVNIRSPRKALRFSIEGTDPDSPRTRVTVHELVDLDANSFIREKARRERAMREEKSESKLALAMHGALEALERAGGSLLSAELEQSLIDSGHARKTAQEALRHLRQERRVLTHRERKQGGRSFTFLPGREPPELPELRENRQLLEAGGEREVVPVGPTAPAGEGTSRATLPREVGEVGEVGEVWPTTIGRGEP